MNPCFAVNDGTVVSLLDVLEAIIVLLTPNCNLLVLSELAIAIFRKIVLVILPSASPVVRAVLCIVALLHLSLITI